MPGAAPSPGSVPATLAAAAFPANTSPSSSSIEASSALCGNCGPSDGGSPVAAAEAIESTLTSQESLHDLCKIFNIPAGYEPSVPGDGGRACHAPAGAICVYEDALAAGMRVPLHPFFAKALRHYGLAPGQLTPNAWRFMAAFIVLCADAGVAKPRLAVFRHFFSVGTYASRDRAGWFFFRAHRWSEYDRWCRLFRTTTSQQLPKNEGWKERFFFLSPPAAAATWPCPVNWGKPSKEAVCDPMLGDKAREDIQKLCRVQESECLDLMSLLTEHKLAAALTPAVVKIEENTAGARTVPETPMGRSPPVAAQSLAITRGQLLGSVDGGYWLQTVLKNAADVAEKETSLLLQELAEAREAEAAAKAELAGARNSEAAAKAELCSATVELGKVRKLEAAAKKARKSEQHANAELVTVKAELVATKAELEKTRKSEAAAIAMLASAKAKVQITDSDNVTPPVLSQSIAVQNQDSTRAHKASHAQLTRLYFSRRKQSKVVGPGYGL